MYPESDLIPIAVLQHYLFCPRQCVLIHVEQAWAENRFTAAGRLLHERVDEAGCFSGEVGAGLPQEGDEMKCVICKHGETGDGVVTVTLERGETTVIVKGVPAQACDNCAEYYLSEDVTTKVLGLAEAAAKKRVEVEILRYVA